MYFFAMVLSWMMRTFSSFLVLPEFDGFMDPVMTISLSMINTLWCMVAGLVSFVTFIPNALSLGS